MGNFMAAAVAGNTKLLHLSGQSFDSATLTLSSPADQ
jgi:hypothetical protein